jgi:hypothetical protein
MVCCGQLLSAQFSANATIDERMEAIQQVINQCAVRQIYCGDTIPETPVQLYYNVPKACTVNCPDGNPFTYTVVAGTFASTTQAKADEDAANFACQQATLRRVCLGNIPGCTCLGSAYSALIPHTGGIGPFVYTVNSGTIPWGLTLNNLTGVISGTPTLNGTYSFTIQITEPDGSYMRKPYHITVLEITTTVLDAYTVGVPYSFQLQVAGGSGNYAWKIVAGSLPAGLTMDNTGLITGTPI